MPSCTASAREAVAGPRLLRGEVVPAERVGAMRVQHVPRVDRVAARLRHLVALRVRHVADADGVSERDVSEQQRRHRERRIEPAARLVDPLAYERRRELFGDLALALERVVELRERHAGAVVPGVDRRSHAVHRAAAAGDRAAPRDVVDERAGGGPAAARRRPRAAPPASRCSGARRRRRTPRSAAACPSSGRARTPSRRCPAASCRSGRRARARGASRSAGSARACRGGGRAWRCTTTPSRSRGASSRSASSAGSCARRARCPTACRPRAARRPRAATASPTNVALVAGDALVVGAVLAHRVDERDPVPLAQHEVLLAERHRRVHEARALVEHDVLGREHGVALRPVVGQAVERRLVSRVDDRAAGEAVEHLGRVAEDVADALLGHDHDLAADARAHVRQRRARSRPRSSRTASTAASSRSAARRPRCSGPRGSVTGSRTVAVTSSVSA